MHQQPPASADASPEARKAKGLPYVKGEAIDFALEELIPKPIVHSEVVQAPMSPAAAAAATSTDGSPKKRKKESLASKFVAQLAAKGEAGVDVTLEEEYPVPAAKIADDSAYDRVDLPALSGSVSKKCSKKEARRMEKAAQHQQELKQKQKGADLLEDPFKDNYGDVPKHEQEGQRSWKDVEELSAQEAGESVLVRGWVQTVRPLSKKVVFLVLRYGTSTVQCALSVNPEVGVSSQMIEFATSLPKESLVNVQGVISIPRKPLKSTTQKIEIQVRKIYCVSRADLNLPFNFEDAVRSDEDILRAKQRGEKLVRVNLETRLNDRPLDLRTPTNQAIFRIQSEVDFEAGVEIEHMGDLNTEAEKKLGQLVRKKYGADFFILYQYPSALRPFYTMPCSEKPGYSNSFDVFLRGEEIISGSQRIHDKDSLQFQIRASGIDHEPLKGFIDSFNYGPPPHGGFGAGLERIVMLFCGLPNIRHASLFPRDTHRLVP